MYFKSVTTKASFATFFGALAVFYVACEGQPRPPSAEPAEPAAHAPADPSAARPPEPATNAVRTRTATPGMTIPGSTPPPGPDGGPNAFAILFDNETRDAAWASQYESGIRQVVAGIKGATLQSVECKTTVCRIEVLHDTVQSTNAFQSAFSQGMHQMLKVTKCGGAIASDPIHLTTTGWFTRDGYWSPNSDGTPRPAQ